MAVCLIYSAIVAKGELDSTRVDPIRSDSRQNFVALACPLSECKLYLLISCNWSILQCTHTHKHTGTVSRRKCTSGVFVLVDSVPNGTAD